MRSKRVLVFKVFKSWGPGVHVLTKCHVRESSKRWRVVSHGGRLSGPGRGARSPNLAGKMSWACRRQLAKLRKVFWACLWGWGECRGPKHAHFAPVCQAAGQGGETFAAVPGLSVSHFFARLCPGVAYLELLLRFLLPVCGEGRSCRTLFCRGTTHSLRMKNISNHT